jgi:DNA (cytosine-5)-methyltransferase 1
MTQPPRAPRLLDLFCGAGGAAMGYHRAGFEVVGVDINPQPHYPFEFHRADALTFPLDGFDAIHASPPCQAYTAMSNRWRVVGKAATVHPKLIEPTRERLATADALTVIENVVGAPVRPDVKLCGFTFGLGVHRHRLFELNTFMLSHPFSCRGWEGHVGVYGDYPDGGRLWTRADGHKPHRRAASLAEGSTAMGIDWMPWRSLKEAIPPAYTEWIGRQLLAAIERAA